MAGRNGAGKNRTGGRKGGTKGGRTGGGSGTGGRPGGGGGRTGGDGGGQARSGGGTDTDDPKGAGNKRTGSGGKGGTKGGRTGGGHGTIAALGGHSACVVAAPGNGGDCPEPASQSLEIPLHGTVAGGGSIEEEAQSNFGHVVGNLYTMVHNGVADFDAANKIVDETLATVGPYVAAWWHDHGSFEALNPYFILGKAENRIRSYKRRIAREAAVSLDFLQEKRGQELPLRAPSVEEQVEIKLEVLAALAGLSDRQKLALVLRFPALRVYLEELSAAEAATVLNLSRNALDQLVHKSKVALQLGLDEQEELGIGI